jgi:hypothetical protein
VFASQKKLLTRQRRSAPACKNPFKKESPVPAPALTFALDPFLLASEFSLVCEKT